jgi:hypothetical protein
MLMNNADDNSWHLKSVETRFFNMSYEVLTALRFYVTVFLVVTPCIHIGYYKCFVGTTHCHSEDRGSRGLDQSVITYMVMVCRSPNYFDCESKGCCNV